MLTKPVVALLEAVAAFDQSILQAARGNPGWAVPIFLAATYVGAGWGIIALLPFVARRITRASTLKLLAAVVVTNLIVVILKASVGRIRPCDALAWCQPLSIASPGGDSFPSGHAAGGFVFAAFVSMIAPRYAPLAILYGVLVAWSRCVLGVHYPIDVGAGALIGAAVGIGFARWEPPWERMGAFGRWATPTQAPSKHRTIEGAPT
jgi:undecaprenyl-diphosphatase